MQLSESEVEEKKLLAEKGSVGEETMLQQQMLIEKSKKPQPLVERPLGE